MNDQHGRDAEPRLLAARAARSSTRSRSGPVTGLERAAHAVRGRPARRHAHVEQRRDRAAPRPRQGGKATLLRVRQGRRRGVPDAELVEAAVRRHPRPPGARSTAATRPRSTRSATASFPKLATGPVRPGTMGYLKDSGTPKPNLKKARSSSWPSTRPSTGRRPTTTYIDVTRPDTVAIAELVKEQAAKFGVTVTIDTVDQATAHQRARSPATSRAWASATTPAAIPTRRACGGRRGRRSTSGASRIPRSTGSSTRVASRPIPAKRTVIYEDLNRRFADQALEPVVVVHGVGDRGASPT